MAYAAMFTSASRAGAPVHDHAHDQARELLGTYARLRFASGTPTAAQLREFERRVSRWRPPRRNVRGSREK